MIFAATSTPSFEVQFTIDMPRRDLPWLTPIPVRSQPTKDASDLLHFMWGRCKREFLNVQSMVEQVIMQGGLEGRSGHYVKSMSSLSTVFVMQFLRAV